VRTGKIVLEEDMNTYEDIFLTSAVIREKVIKALKLKPNITECHTVGIISFINKSGTDRSDKLNLELQKSIRQRLRSETWATLLERQYPTGLLEEVELDRMGLTKDNVEKLPPADMVIFGTLQDISRSYKGNTWDVNIELLVRLEKRTASFTITCHSDCLEETAKRIVEEINNFRRKQTESFSVKQEKELWRQQALYLMPRSSYQVGRYYFDCISEREKRDTIEAIRAWENLLLLAPDNSEANLNLGMCLVSLYRFDLVRAMNSHVQNKMAEKQTMRGSLLVETAMRADPTPHNIRTFAFLVDIQLLYRSGEICEFILANQKMFESYEIKNAGMRLASLRKDSLIYEIDKAVHDVDKDPSLVLTFFIKLQNNYGDSPDVAINCARKYTDSDSSIVRFCAEWTIADMLYRYKKDPSALLHFDRAIEAHDGAYTAMAKCSAAHYGTIDDIYRYKISACNLLNKPNIARETVLSGVKYFTDADRFNHAIDWLYFYCLTEVLTDHDAEQGVAICDTYLKVQNRDGERHQDHYRSAVIEAKKKFTAIVAGTSQPDFSRMTLIEGTEMLWVRGPKMTGAGGKVWLSWGVMPHEGRALVYSPGKKSVQSVKGVQGKVASVAAIGKEVFFGGVGGIYKVNLAGELVKHYQKGLNEIPSNHIVDLCTGAGKLYMSFRESDRYGVAVLDPASNDAMVLAPTSREATLQTEPVYDVKRIWWDATNNQLYANNFFLFETERHHCTSSAKMRQIHL
jgi:tetratricopeptide (TPR) repeat protein